MDTKEISQKAARVADKAMDPVGTIIMVMFFFLNKYTILNFDGDDVLMISALLGALRIIWESAKRRGYLKSKEST